jgi:hypothetical protein
VDGQLQYDVRDALAAGCGTLVAVAEHVGRPVGEVDEAVRWCVTHGFVVGWEQPGAVVLQLTPQGWNEVRFRQGLTSAMNAPGGADLTDIVSQISQGWSEGKAMEAQRRQAAQVNVLIGDEERDNATRALSDAYGDGRIDLAELERRSALAVAAATRGDLAAALRDLPLLSAVPSRTPSLVQWMRRLGMARKVVGIAIAVALVGGWVFVVVRSAG